MAVCYESLTIIQCNALLSLAGGMKAARVWQSGVGTGVLLELGRLQKRALLTRKGFCLKGQITLMVHSEWRVERPRSIMVGSLSPQRHVDRQLPSLVGLRVSELAVDPDWKELRLDFSDGRRFRTFEGRYRQPQWTALMHDDSLLSLADVWKNVDVTPCVHVMNGRPCIEYCFDPAGANLAALRKTYRVPRNA